MGFIHERSDSSAELRRRLAVCEQEHEQMTVALEDAHAEVRRLAEQIERLQVSNAQLARQAGELTHLTERLSRRRKDNGRPAAPSPRMQEDNAMLAEELRVTVEELQVTAEELEEANAELRRLNEDLERRVEQRTAELRQALDERDTLLRHKDMLIGEINHRVKNSFQMVASLLNLQGRKAAPETREALQVAIGRIYAIARVHALLYAKGGVDSVEFGAYLGDVCANLAASFGVDGRRRTLVVEADSIRVSVDIALSLATAVNELVTNALWHAFDANQTGTVWVQFQRKEDGRLSLTVADDGRGLPKRMSSGLGMQIVSSIAEGLKADLEIGRTSGTRFTLTLAHG